jgi:hypothetical protein
VITIRCEEHDYTAPHPLKYAALDNGLVVVDRVDDCRCFVLIKGEEEEGLIGIGQLRRLAKFINLAADFFDAERHIPVQPHEPIEFEAKCLF